ncbi:MAG: hypothetical protein EOO04_38920 [Chitinophagaceae bacterium]|nr:MAG: hypothetical protein EOO04_38920 [Chitinophagaceae bacterium]
MTNIKADSVISGLPAAYWVDLNKMNQATIAKGLTKPRIFIAQGGMDFQVTKSDYDIWTSTLSGKKNVKLQFYPTLDHFFMVQTEKGNPSQYEKPSNVSQQFVTDLANWIKGS